MNVFSMMLYGFTLELHYGRPTFLFVFFTAAIAGIKDFVSAGNFASLYLYPDDLMAGAASGVYGVFAL